MSFCAFAQLVTTFIFFSALDKSRVKCDNSPKIQHRKWGSTKQKNQYFTRPRSYFKTSVQNWADTYLPLYLFTSLSYQQRPAVLPEPEYWLSMWHLWYFLDCWSLNRQLFYKSMHVGMKVEVFGLSVCNISSAVQLTRLVSMDTLNIKLWKITFLPDLGHTLIIYNFLLPC